MSVMRAKMVANQVNKLTDGMEELKFSAVHKSEGYDEGGLDENNSFATFTPCAELSMTVNNPALVGAIKEGQEFYVDFTLACDECVGVHQAEKTPTEELQYLGQMLTATTIDDVTRISAIQYRLAELVS